MPESQAVLTRKPPKRNTTLVGVRVPNREIEVWQQVAARRGITVQELMRLGATLYCHHDAVEQTREASRA